MGFIFVLPIIQVKIDGQTNFLDQTDLYWPPYAQKNSQKNNFHYILRFNLIRFSGRTKNHKSSRSAVQQKFRVISFSKKWPKSAKWSHFAPFWDNKDLNQNSTSSIMGARHFYCLCEKSWCGLKNRSSYIAKCNANCSKSAFGDMANVANIGPFGLKLVCPSILT